MVDSNEEFRSYLETCLSEEYIVRGFENGADALGYIKNEHPDLVICDTVLNGMGGDELSSRLKTSKETSIIPVILYGSHIDADQRSKREASLADTFMHTPFHVEDLKIEIAVLIRNSRLLRKAFLHKVFGEHFLQVQPVEIIKEATEGARNSLINEVKDYILERIEHEDLTIDAIASHLRMSRTKFYNRWKTLTGEAPTVFIEAIRMEKAHELLESGKYPVGTIPEMIGLKDVKTSATDIKNTSELPLKNLSRKIVGIKRTYKNMSGGTPAWYLRRNRLEYLFLFICLMQYSVISGIYSMYVHLNFEN